MKKSKLKLPKNPTLKDFQEYTLEMCVERGFDKETLQDAFILMTEEIGELARVVRKATGVKVDVTAKDKHAAEELADVLIYILTIANIMGIDLEQAFLEKEEINKKRLWR